MMKYLRVPLVLSVAAIGISAYSPINDTVNRLLFLGGVIGIWLALVLLVWRHRLGRRGLFAVPFIVVVIVMLPGRASQKALHQAYVQRLKGYAETPYVWGGENKRGIDCSGLPRRALQEALLWQGLRQFDGSCVREAVVQWWQDASARDLGTGLRDLTVSLGIRGKIRDLKTIDLWPGDFAVTADGVHLVVYLGDEQWIQADPSAMKVISQDGRTAENPWFSRTVTLHRWRLLGQRLD